MRSIGAPSNHSTGKYLAVAHQILGQAGAAEHQLHEQGILIRKLHEDPLDSGCHSHILEHGLETKPKKVATYNLYFFVAKCAY